MANNQRNQRKNYPVLRIWCVWLTAAIFFIPLKNIHQNESPNNRENLESDGEKQPSTSIVYFGTHHQILTTLRTYRNCTRTFRYLYKFLTFGYKFPKTPCYHCMNANLHVTITIIVKTP